MSMSSGASFIYGPPLAVQAFYSHIPGAKPFNSHGYYQFPCSPAPIVSFKWGRKNWEITPEKLVEQMVLPFVETHWALYHIHPSTTTIYITASFWVAHTKALGIV
jgi:hypothetical protein